MNSADTIYFTRIFADAEKEKLFEDLAAQNGEIIAKKPDPLADVFIIKAQSCKSTFIMAKLIHKMELVETQGNLLFQFFLGGEKYYFQADFKRTQEQIQIAMPADLFKLQRRLDFRIKVPSSFPLKFRVLKLNDLDCDFIIGISDLSGGGCRFEWGPMHPVMNSGDLFSGMLITPDRGTLEISALVKHTQPNPLKKNGKSFGIQFVNLRESVKNKIVALVMDLYRAFFTKLPR